MFQPRLRWERKAAWMFWYTVRRGKMLVRWKDRPMPRRQRSWGAMPVTSRALKITRPASGVRCPVIRLKSVVLPAPLGPMMALMEPWGTVTLTPPTAWKPSKLFWTSRTSSTGPPPSPPAPQRGGGSGEAAREREEQEDEDRAEDQGPVLRVGDDLLVEPEQDHRSDGRAEERAHAAEQGHDQHLGGLGPVREVGEDPAVVDAEEAARQPREPAGEDEGGQLVAAHVDADELGALRILPDGREHPAEGRADDAPEDPEAEPDRQQGEEVEVLGGAIAPHEGQQAGEALEPAEVGVGDLRHALLAARHLVPLEADGPDDLGEGESQHGEIDLGQPDAEEAEQRGERGCDEAGGGEGQEEGHPGLLHEDAGRVGADAEVGGVTEGDEARVAHQEVQARGEERPDGDVVGEERVEARAHRRHREHREEHQQPPGD